MPTNAAPLTFVLGVAAIKDALEDIRKHKADDVENNRTTRTLQKDGKEDPKPWKDVKVGDIVKLKNRELVAADMILLATSDANGLAYTMTANLDGETNLKLRKAHPDALGLGLPADPAEKITAAAAVKVSATPKHDMTDESLTISPVRTHPPGTVEALAPNKNLEVFDTTFRRTGAPEPLSFSKINTMMRGVSCGTRTGSSVWSFIQAPSPRFKRTSKARRSK